MKAKKDTKNAVEIFRVTSWNWQAKQHIKRPKKGKALCGKILNDYSTRKKVQREWVEKSQRMICVHCWKRYKNGEIDFSCDRSKVII